MIQGLLRDMEAEAIRIFAEFRVPFPEKLVKCYHHNNIMEIDVNPYNHGDEVMPSFHVRFWIANAGDTWGDGSQRSTFVNYQGHISDCSLAILNRLIPMLPDTWRTGPESFVMPRSTDHRSEVESVVMYPGSN